MFRSFSIRVVVRVILLVITTSTFAFIFGDERLFFNHIIVAIIIIIQVAELIHYVNRTNRELARLFNAIKHSDFSSSFQQTYHGKSFDQLNDSLQGIMRAYREVKIEKEAQFHFLQMLIGHLPVGIISLRDDDEITLINPMAAEMLKQDAVTCWRDIQQNRSEFANAIAEMSEGGRRLVDLNIDSESYLLSVDVSSIFLIDRKHTLITFQNINSEIEQKEIEAWHRLIRILTHEIMNSVTPISSLTETLKGMIENADGKVKKVHELKPDILSDLQFSLKTIQKRSDGLLMFVDHYRKFTKVPRPMVDRLSVSDLFEAVGKLMRPEISEHQIDFSYAVDTDAEELYADRALIEQVLINLISNSIHALEGRPYPSIALRGRRLQQNLIVEVSDNGRGISEKDRDEIFVPFFTTRKNGSGIGLSLSKQILSLHGGSIRVESEENVGTTFLLRFRFRSGEAGASDGHQANRMPGHRS